MSKQKTFTESILGILCLGICVILLIGVSLF